MIASDAAEWIIVALIPVSVTLVCGLMAWMIRSISQLVSKSDRHEQQLATIEELLERQP